MGAYITKVKSLNEKNNDSLSKALEKWQVGPERPKGSSDSSDCRKKERLR